MAILGFPFMMGEVIGVNGIKIRVFTDIPT
jgi:hypothetical protein